MASSKNTQMAGLDKEYASREALPALLIQAPSQAIDGFDCVGDDTSAPPLHEQGTELVPDKDSEVGNLGSKKDIVINIPTAVAPIVQAGMQIPYSISLSLPASPSGFHLAQFKMVVNSDQAQAGPVETKLDVHPAEPAQGSLPLQLWRQTRFHSQPILTSKNGEQRRTLRSDSTRDSRFDRFKTFSGRLERQLSNLRGKPQEPDIKASESKISEETDDAPAVDRYFDALEGPELDTLRDTEEAVLPKDEKWPFLLRFPISAFGMCLGVSSQAMLWKTLSTAPSMEFLHVSPTVNHVLWYVSLALMGLVSLIYLLKIVFYFEAVRREFYHPIRVNFFFAPWIACLFLVSGVPRPVTTVHHAVWYVFMAPLFCLELKIYGQWMSGGERRLSKVANPSNHLSIVGNFIGALLGAKMGLREGPIFFFAVGLAHYMVLFVTLYQRLPTNVQLPKELHPVFFLFVAAPSVASMAWAKICGEFNLGARIAYFIALFLYMSLVVRINLFRGFRFSLAWWAYTFPMTGAAIATITYASEVTNVLTRSLSIGLSGIATVTVGGVFLTTMYHAFVRRDLFPNDVSIAITRKKPKFSKILAQLRTSSSDMKELVLSISKTTSDAKDSDDSSVSQTSGSTSDSSATKAETERV